MQLIFFGLWSGQLTSFIFIQSYEAGFYKPTIHKLHPPISRITAHATMPGWLENYPQYHVQAFDPNEWCPKNSLLSGGLNPGPLSPESCALTTRPRLLA